ncbi:fimbrial protein, partial [Serratia marcescens]
MKKMIYCLVACMLGGYFITARASDGGLQIIADVVKPACNLQTRNLTVMLGNIDTAEMDFWNGASAFVPFKFKFLDCVPGTPVSVTFEGDMKQGIFALDDSAESA